MIESCALERQVVETDLKAQSFPSANSSPELRLHRRRLDCLPYQSYSSRLDWRASSEDKDYQIWRAVVAACLHGREILRLINY